MVRPVGVEPTLDRPSTCCLCLWTTAAWWESPESNRCKPCASSRCSTSELDSHRWCPRESNPERSVYQTEQVNTGPSSTVGLLGVEPSGRPYKRHWGYRPHRPVRAVGVEPTLTSL